MAKTRKRSKKSSSASKVSKDRLHKYNKGRAPKAGLTWRKGHTRSDGTRVSGVWVKSAKKTTRKSPAKKRKSTTKRKNPVAIMRTAKVKPVGMSPRHGKYAIVSASNRLLKSFNIAKNARAEYKKMLDTGSKGIRLVRVAVSLVKNPSKSTKNPSRRRATTKRKNPSKRKTSRRATKRTKAASYSQVLRQLGIR